MLIYDDLWHNYDLINHYTSVVGLLITLIGKIYIGVIAVTPPPPTELIIATNFCGVCWVQVPACWEKFS